MTRPIILASVLSTLTAGTFASTEGYRFARARLVEPSVAIQRASESDADELVANAPFLAGDRVWTDAGGRAEFQLFDGTLLWVNTRSKVDYATNDQSGASAPVVLQLWSGSLSADRRQSNAAQLDIETSAATVHVEPGAIVRVDAGPDATRVSVRLGAAQVDADEGDVSVQAGETAEIRPGRPPQARWRTSDADDFDAWVHARAATATAVDNRYLPEELAPYAGELEENGNWYHEPDAGYVWQPRVGTDWSPYTSGHWTWTVIGWTWVPEERWGWAPSHYGRWGHSARLGWYWIPDRTFGPAWVSWAVGSSHVGWCALDRRNRPILRAAVHRGRHERDGWTFVRRGDFGARNLRARRAANVALDSSAFHLFESNRRRPDRRLDVALDAQRALPAASQRTSTWLRRPESRRERPRTFAVQRSDDAPALSRERARSEASASWLARQPDARAHERSDREGSRTRTGVGDRPRWFSPARTRQEERRVQSPSTRQELRGTQRHNLMERALGRRSEPQPETVPQARRSSAQPQERPPASSDSSRSSSDGASRRHPSRRDR